MFTINAVDNPRPEWNEMFFYEYGYAKVTAVDASRLEWTWINSQTNEPMDNTVIIQSSRSSSGSNGNDDSLSPGEQAGITIASLLGLTAILFAVYWYFFKTPKRFTSFDDVPGQSLIHRGMSNSSGRNNGNIAMMNFESDVVDRALMTESIDDNNIENSTRSSDIIDPREGHVSL